MQPIPATVANMATYARAGLVLLDPATGETFSATPGDYFMRDRDETMTNADGEPLVLAIRHAEHAAPLYETPDAPTVSERIRRRREARAAVTGGIVIPPDCTGYEDELGFLAHDGDTCPVHEAGLDIGDGDAGEGF